MTEVAVRVLEEADWATYREVRLGALAESPGSFTAVLADEADRDEQFWRDRMTRSFRLVAEQDSKALGIVSLGPYGPDPSSGECYGLYVVPEARGAGVAWRLIEAVAALANRQGYRRLYYWVGTDNPRAIGFGKNFGFRTTSYRRPARSADLALGEEEMAMVLSLAADTTSTPNPTRDTPTARQGPML